jgi:hypothetical protein
MFRAEKVGKMSALALNTANTPAFQYQSRYCYRPDVEDDRKVIQLKAVRGTLTVRLKGALQALGQFCVVRKNSGVLFAYEIHQALAESGVPAKTTRKRLRRDLVACGVLEDLGDGYRLVDYLKNNNTPEQWAEIERTRKQKRAQQQRTRRARQRELKRAEQARQPDSGAGVKPQGGGIWPPPSEESPDTRTVSDISGGEAYHLIGERSEPITPLTLPDVSGPKGFTTPSATDRRPGGDLQSTSPTSIQPRYTGRPAEEVGGGETATRDSAPEKPRRILPWKPRPRVVKAKSKALGPDKSGLCEVKTLIQDICAKMAARGAAEKAGESPTGVGVR